MTAIHLDELPEELARDLFEALRLEIHYKHTNQATCRITLTGQTITAARHAAHNASLTPIRHNQTGDQQEPHNDDQGNAAANDHAVPILAAPPARLEPATGSTASEAQTLLQIGQRDALGFRGLVDLASVGAAGLAWREGPVEDWHRVGRISQGEMMRFNAAATRTVREVLMASVTDRGLREGPSVVEASVVTVFAELRQRLADPHRRLPDGRSLVELARSREAFEEFGRHVDRRCRRWAELALERGLRQVLIHLACHALGRVRRWWLLPDWQARVAEFVGRLEDPGRWDVPEIAEYIRRQKFPADVVDLGALRIRLLEGPDRLSAAAADYCLRAGLRDLLPQQYGWTYASWHELPAACFDLQASAVAAFVLEGLPE